MNVVVVADGSRISLGCALNILVSQKTFPDAEFHVGVPENSDFGSAIAQNIIEAKATSIFSIPKSEITVSGKPYRIINKINALRSFGPKPALLIDSDILFIRSLPEEFLFRSAVCAVPEHGLHEFPWKRLYNVIGLEPPVFQVLLGGGQVSLPWFNAGLVSCPNAEKLGEIWRMLTDFTNRCDWVPERWPYLDQICLPLAMAQAAETKTLTYENVLPGRFNQNLFYWAEDQSHVTNGFVIHHHNRIQLIETYFPRLFMWIRDGYPMIDAVVNELRSFDRSDG